MRFFTLALVATSLSSFAAHAAGSNPAHIAAMSGKVLVNSGKGFHAAKTNNPLRLGETIFVSKGSSVTIAYEEAHCTVTYSMPQNVILSESAPCAAGQNLAMVDDKVIEPANFAMIPGGSLAFPQLVGLSTFALPLTFGVVTTVQRTISAP